MKKTLEKLDDWLVDNSKPYLWLYRLWHHKLYYPCFKTFKYFLQRTFRGWGDDEAWCLHYNISKRFTKPLKHFRANLTSYPPKITYEEWTKIIDKIIIAFEIEVKDDGVSMSVSDRKLHEEGFELFFKWYFHLWD